MNAVEKMTPQWRRHEGGLVAHSVDVADFFGKEHRHVLRVISELLSTSPKLGALNWFNATTYRDPKGENRPAFIMPFEGFSLLVMGFTGEKALEFKLLWIEAFKAQGGIISMMSEQLPAAFNDEGKLLALLTAYGEQGGRVEDLMERALDMLRGVDRKTSVICEGVTSLRSEVRSKRKEFSEQTKRTLLWATMMLGRRCPCCGTIDVANPNGEKAPGAQFDHFFSNHFANPDSGWLICGDCHHRLNNNPVLRHEVTPQFKAFQNQRSRVGDPQADFWK